MEIGSCISYVTLYVVRHCVIRYKYRSKMVFREHLKKLNQRICEENPAKRDLNKEPLEYS